MKVLGAELIAFFAEEWPAGWYIDEMAIEEEIGDPFIADNETRLKPGVTYDLQDFGVILWDAPIDDIGPKHPYLTHHDSTERCFKRWQKLRTTRCVVVELPKDADFETFKKLIAGWKGKVLK